MDSSSRLVGAVKTSNHPGVGPGHVVAIVGKRFPGAQPRSLSDDLVAFDDLSLAVRLLDHPFATIQLDRVVGPVFDRDEIYKSVRFVHG